MSSDPEVPAEHAIALVGVAKRFGEARALDGIDLKVARGSVFGFLGPNGAGKTTTLRILLGLVRPDAGRASVAGLDPVTDGRRVRARIGALLEHDGLYDRLSALDNLDYHARLQGLGAAERAARAEELLRAFELWGRRGDRVVGWSKGMRQRLAIARALTHRPQLLLLDEPFSGLDPVAAVELRDALVRLARDEHVTVLLTTHDLAHVEKICDRVAVIDQGRVVAEGRLGELSGGDELEVAVSGAGLDAEVLQALVAAGAIARYQVGDGGARVFCDAAQRPRLGQELCARGVALEELHTVRRSLEDTFLQLMRRR